MILTYIFKIYQWLKRHEETVLIGLFTTTIIFATFVYYCIYQLDLIDAIIFSISLFALDTKIPNDFGIDYPAVEWKLIYFSSFTGFLTTFLTVTLIFMDKIFSNWNVKRIQKQKDFILVLGLGHNNKIYIESELTSNTKTNILVIEQNQNNQYIETLRQKNVGIIIGDATDKYLLNTINLTNSKHIIISVGNDVKNLEITTQLLDINNKLKLYTNLEDRNLRHFHDENRLLQGNNIKLYSYYEDTSRELFETYDIDGNSNHIITSNEDYSIIIIGNNKLAYEIIYQACIMGQLPNENQLTIHCVDNDVNLFKQNIELMYTEINNVPNVNINYIELDFKSKDFYVHDFWHNCNLTNIILCYENEQSNLDIIANLANITYLQEITERKLNTNILLNSFSSYNISHAINCNNNSLNNFFIFGLKSDICTNEYLIAGKRDSNAKSINDFYNKNATKDQQKDWLERSYFEKESNRACADHIKIKQKYFKNNLDNNNKEILAKCEHNRWNAFHFLHGWKYSKTKNKQLKHHNCLLPYKELSEDYKQYDRDIVNISLTL